MLAVTVTSHDQCLAIVRWLAAGGCRRRYRYLPSPAAAAASRHRYHRYRRCAGNSFTPSRSLSVCVAAVALHRHQPNVIEANTKDRAVYCLCV
jgi:hypothetical protein